LINDSTSKTDSDAVWAAIYASFARSILQGRWTHANR